MFCSSSTTKESTASSRHIATANAGGEEILRAVQVRRPNSTSRTSGFGFGKLWFVAEMKNVRPMRESFTPDDPDYNPNDSAMAQIHCRI